MTRAEQDYGYVTCMDCGHYVAWSTEPPRRCESCGCGALWMFDTADEAEEESQAIMDATQ